MFGRENSKHALHAAEATKLAKEGKIEESKKVLKHILEHEDMILGNLKKLTDEGIYWYEMAIKNALKSDDPHEIDDQTAHATQILHENILPTIKKIYEEEIKEAQK